MPSVDIRLCPEERKALLTSPIAMRRHVLNEDYWTRDVPWPGDADEPASRVEGAASNHLVATPAVTAVACEEERA